MSVPQATQNDAQNFCDLCEEVYVCWTTHLHLFENLPERLQQEQNVNIDEFLETPHGWCLCRLNEISRRYLFLEIAKLHDPARQGRNKNLSIDFFVKQKFWSEKEKESISAFTTELNNLYEKLKPVRNKILAHNDRSVFAKNETLGIFPEGEDENYFRALGKLCSMIWKKFPDLNKLLLPYGDRSFEFTKSGISEDPLCPAYDARQLSDLIVGAIPKISKMSI